MPLLFSEGGLKFKGLKENKNVGIAIFEPYGGFDQLKSLQVQGEAVMVELFSDEYLIKMVPTTYDYLDSDLKKDGFGSRQHLEV